MWLPDGEEIVMLSFLVLTQYWRVTDGRTDGQTDGETGGTDRHVARVKIIVTLRGAV